MPNEAAKTEDPATDYASAVVAGKIVAARLVRLACQRHLRDLETGHERGLFFDIEAAAHAIGFFDWLNLPEGDRPFVLSPFEKFIVGSLFGWKGPDTYRRFRTAYIEIAKGGGKTPLAAGIGLYGLTADEELAAEVYPAAITREQAGITFRDAKRMAEGSPALAGRLDIQAHSITHPESGSVLRAVSSEHRGLDGKRVHIAIVDELHEHTSSLVVDKLRAGTKGRNQALIFEITNSGFDRESVCWQHHDYSERVLRGVVNDDSWFAFVCGLDACEKCRSDGKAQPVDGCPDCDDWRDESKWIKANPNLGVSVTEKYLREQVHEAEGMPSKANIVKRLNFCIWTEGFSTWIPDDQWLACATGFSQAALEGRDCYAGLDLAFRSDLASLALVFPVDADFHLISFSWLPEEGNRDLRKEPIASFLRQGLIDLTPGPATEFAAIRAKVNQLGKRYNIRGIAVDPWQATQLSGELISDGFAVSEFGQTLRNFSEPTKEFGTLVKGRRMRHDGNALFRWQLGNVQIELDAAGNCKPSKRKSGERIDAPVAAVMALGLALSPVEEKSIYAVYGNLSL